jgi:hypothetical protein
MARSPSRPAGNRRSRDDSLRGDRDPPRERASDRSGDSRDDDPDSDEAILQEAKDRFKRAMDWESAFRVLYIADVKFANGDSDNGWQWPDAIRNARADMANPRPCLTINKTANHVALVTDNGKRNQPAISVKPTGENSSFEAAQAREGIIRHIQYISSAGTIYEDAMESQTEGGIAYWRVNTCYVDDESFDQHIVIQPIRDQLGVFLDTDIKEKDGSDACWGFVFDEMDRKEFERQYSDIELPAASTGLGDDDWVRLNNVRIAEYYRLKFTDDELIYMEDVDGTTATFKRSEVPAKFRRQIAEAEKPGSDIKVKRRKVRVPELQWFKIAGNEIIDRRDGGDGSTPLKGKYIPIVRVVGKERIIEGKLERKGIVRPLKDPQRMYNYNSSGQVEFGALQTRTPWVGPAAAFEGNTAAWNNANRTNAAYLTYRDWDDEHNREIKEPKRPDPPGTSPAFVEGMRIAASEMEMASGQYQAQHQNPNIERTPQAINAREHATDITAQPFVNNLAVAIRYTGKIILDLIPHIYDTERVIQILGKDGSQQSIMIKPDAQNAYEEAKDRDDIAAVLNPTMGKYEVQSDVGPSYATQRQEAWNAFVQIVTGSPELINKIGDLMFKSADFPMADEIAERLKKDIQQAMPWLFDETAMTPQVKALQQQVQQGTEQVAELLQELARMRLKLTGKDQARDIQAYDAESKRITALSNAQPELAKTGQEGELQQIIRKTVLEMLAGQPIGEEVNREQAEQNVGGGAGGESAGGNAGGIPGLNGGAGEGMLPG